MTNLNKTKEKIIFEILLSLNNGDVGYRDAESRVQLAKEQYDELVKQGIVIDENVDDYLEDESTDAEGNNTEDELVESTNEAVSSSIMSRLLKV